MFSYNRGNRPKTTCVFRLVRQLVAPAGRQTTSLGRNRQVTASGAKYAVSDCILFEVSLSKRLVIRKITDVRFKKSQQSSLHRVIVRVCSCRRVDLNWIELNSSQFGLFRRYQRFYTRDDFSPVEFIFGDLSWPYVYVDPRGSLV